MFSCEPSDSLKLVRAVDTGENGFVSELTVVNKGDVSVVFKIKTTNQKRYLVKPNQGYLEGNGEKIIKVTVPEQRCESVLLALKLKTFKDKFLVQHLPLTAEKNEEFMKLSEEEKPNFVQSQIKNIPKSDGMKIPCVFMLEEEELESPQAKEDESTEKAVEAPIEAVTTDPPVVEEAPEKPAHEKPAEARQVLEIREKYQNVRDRALYFDDLQTVRHMTTLQASNKQFQSENKALKAEKAEMSEKMERLIMELEQVRRDLKAQEAAVSAPPASDPTAAESPPASILTVVVVALIAFLLGILMKML